MEQITPRQNASGSTLQKPIGMPGRLLESYKQGYEGGGVSAAAVWTPEAKTAGWKPSALDGQHSGYSLLTATWLPP